MEILKDTQMGHFDYLTLAFTFITIAPHAPELQVSLYKEAFLGPWWVRTLESGLSIGILNEKSGLNGPNPPESQKCLLGWA